MKRSYHPERLKAWRAAEEALHSPAKGLPDRLAWLHRAMAALHAGKRDAVAALAAEARAAGHTDIALILETCATPKEALDPTALLKQAKKTAYPNRVERFPNLVRGLAALRQGKPATNLIAQADIPLERPALYSLVLGFSSTAQQVKTTQELDKVLPRADVAMAAVWDLRLGALPVRADHPYFKPLDLSAKRYPDLYETRGPEAQLRARVYGREPWTNANAHDNVAIYLNKLPQPQLKSWLAAILGRLHRDISAGKLAGLSGMTHAAAHAAGLLPELPNLARQLAMLDLRLDWLTDPQDPAPFLFRQLWLQNRGLSQAERLVIARVIGPMALEHDGRMRELLGDDARDEVFSFLAVHEPKLADAEAYAQALEDTPPAKLEALLRAVAASPARRLFTLGMAAATRKDLDAALVHLNGLAPYPTELQTLGRELRVAAKYSNLSRAFRRNLSKMLDNAASDNLVLALAGLCVHAEPMPASYPPKLARALASMTDTADAIDLALAAGLTDLAREQVAVLGRTLRKLPPEKATERATRVVAEILESQLPDPGAPHYEVLEPLMRFALRDGAPPVLAVLGEMTDVDDLEFWGPMFWILRDMERLGGPKLLAEFLAHHFPYLEEDAILLSGLRAVSEAIHRDALEAALKERHATPAAWLARVDALMTEALAKDIKKFARSQGADAPGFDVAEMLNRLNTQGY